MSNTDIAQASLSAWCNSEWDTLSSMLTDDFQFGDPPDHLDKNGFLAFGRVMLTAFPDYATNESGFREEGDKVYCTEHITGTHTGTLAVPDLPTVPPTGKRIDLPPDNLIWTIRGGQISHLAITFPPDGGMPALYAQLGVPLG
jgi:predicted ester cyclase